MLIQLEERQINILLTIMGFVTVNNKQIPLKTITETLNAMAGSTQTEKPIITSEVLQAFSNIFNELLINNVNVPIRDIISITNALQSPQDMNYDRIPDIVKQAQAEDSAADKK